MRPVDDEAAMSDEDMKWMALQMCVVVKLRLLMAVDPLAYFAVKCQVDEMVRERDRGLN